MKFFNGKGSVFLKKYNVRALYTIQAILFENGISNFKFFIIFEQKKEKKNQKSYIYNSIFWK